MKIKKLQLKVTTRVGSIEEEKEELELGKSLINLLFPKYKESKGIRNN